MRLFMSTTTNKVDGKGRVSVPAPFRQVVAGTTFNGVVLYPSLSVDAIDGCPMERIEELSRSIDQFNPLGDSHTSFAASIMAAATPLAFDGDGRIQLPEDLITFAGITDRASFVGLGQSFQIWEPEAFRAFQAKAREEARQKRDDLRWAPPRVTQ
ncbi:division/cell wall cluster transcriptional repressor MraZ [Zavarzinia sp. CC-PAN008]|uniref:division/cell wall cluster transcriptional repressor MraZ n=1 Tax=Zavarzinia sp. CC-PAN008 TaxID=3243332 RepID=UPI003F74790E